MRKRCKYARQRIFFNQNSRANQNLRDFFDDVKIDILFEQNRKDHAIDLIENKKSSYMSLYNLSQTKLTTLRRYSENVLIKDWIKHSMSFANVLILFVLKKNENLRLCVNYKRLNAMTIKNRHSLFLIIETLDRLNDVKCFIKLNLKNVYHRIRIKQDDEWKTTFRTRYNYFKYQFMSFELINVSIIFQVYINKTLRELIDVICVIHLNDIFIFNENETQHWNHVQTMLKRLRDFKLYISIWKNVNSISFKSNF